MSPGLAGVLNLGDTIDGRESLAESLQDLEEMTAVFDALGPQLPILHVIGNHDLRVPRQECLARLRLPAPYYRHPLGPGWRLLVLDTTQLTSGSGWEQ
ncbi:manganese-dependent ADP-ribose CDP-alcohol diphosphatase, partial [Haematococcus lacustris]